MSTTLYLKHMVCNRCIMVVKDELIKLSFRPEAVNLGNVIFREELTEDNIKLIKERLEPIGFELIDDKRIRLIDQIKNIIVKQIHHSEDILKMNLSNYLSEKLNYEYTYLSSLFSEIENTTIEQYYIAQKMERVKELLEYDELSLNEIADLMGYSSSAYLSSQFKKIVGTTPSIFKKNKEEKRKPLDQV